MSVTYLLATYPEVYADSGNPLDIQVAIAQAQTIGGRVHILVPFGDYTWHNESVVIPGNVFLFGNGSLIRTAQSNHNPFLSVEARNDQRARISGFKFYGLMTSTDVGVNGTAIQVKYGIDFRIDHVEFYDFPDAAISVGSPYASDKCRGLIDHFLIDNPYKDVYTGSIWAYGIVVSGAYQNWESDITKFLGKYETAPLTVPVLYVEDGTFRRCRHAIASTQAAWYVIRHCIEEEPRPINYGQIDVHGTAGDTKPGGRGLECYENDIIGKSASASIGCLIRGGGGVIFNNIFTNNMINIRLMADSPVEEYQVNALYIYNNTGLGVMVEDYPNVYVEGQDYFLNAPPNYTPYPYPHPLTLEEIPPPPSLVTPWTGELEEGTYRITVPSKTQVGSNYQFDHWELDGVNVGSVNPFPVMMDADHMLIAVFTEVISPPTPLPATLIGASLLGVIAILEGV